MKKLSLVFLILISFSLVKASTIITSINLDKEIYEPGDLAKINVSVFSNEEKYFFPELEINFKKYKSELIKTIGGEKTYTFYVRVPEKEGNYNLNVYLSDDKSTTLQKSIAIIVKPLLRQFILNLEPLEQTAIPGEIINYNLSITNIGSEKERIILEDYNIQVYNLPKDYIDVEPMETKKMVLSVKIPEELKDGVYEFKLKACSTYNWNCENISSSLGIYHRTNNEIVFHSTTSENIGLSKTLTPSFYIKNNNEFIENYVLKLTLPDSWFEEPTLLNQDYVLTKEFLLNPGEEANIYFELTPQVLGTHLLKYELFSERSDNALISGVLNVKVRDANKITGAFINMTKTKWFYGTILIMSLIVLGIIIYFLYKENKEYPYSKNEVKVPEIPKMNIVKDNKELDEWKKRV